MRTFAPTDNPETSVVAMKASNWPSPTAAMDVAPRPPTRKTAAMPSVRWSRLLTVTGKARVRTDFLICAMRDAMAGHPNRMKKTVIWFIWFVSFVWLNED